MPKRQTPPAIFPPRLARLLAYVERSDSRWALWNWPHLANELRRGGFPVAARPVVSRDIYVRPPAPWHEALLDSETEPVLCVVLIALCARRPEALIMRERKHKRTLWPAGTDPRQIRARVRALWLARQDALDPEQLDPWLPLPERGRWFLRRAAQVYDRHAHVGAPFPAAARRLPPAGRRRIGITPRSRRTDLAG